MTFKFWHWGWEKELQGGDSCKADEKGKTLPKKFTARQDKAVWKKPPKKKPQNNKNPQNPMQAPPKKKPKTTPPKGKHKKKPKQFPTRPTETHR